MQSLSISPTFVTPRIVFNPNASQFEISGNSFLENQQDFYTNVVEWVSNNEGEFPEWTELIFRMDFVCTTSMKSLQLLLTSLKSIVNHGKNLKISWYYNQNDEDIKETGKKLSQFTGISFDIQSMSNINWANSSTNDFLH